MTTFSNSYEPDLNVKFIYINTGT